MNEAHNGTPLVSGSASADNHEFTNLLAVMGPLSKSARAHALQRLEIVRPQRLLVEKLRVCLGLASSTKDASTDLDQQSMTKQMQPNSTGNGQKPGAGASPPIVFEKEVSVVFNFGPQNGIVSTGAGATVHQAVGPAGGVTEAQPGAAQAQPSTPVTQDFRSEQQLAEFLRAWVNDFGQARAGGGTGRSGNAVLKAQWHGQPALLKTSPDAAALGREAAHLEALRQQGASLSIARLYASAEVREGEDRWMAYLMEPVGEMSLRDYLFTATPSPQEFLTSLGHGLKALYGRTARAIPSSGFVQDYLKDIGKCLGKARGYASFAALGPSFDTELLIKGVKLAGPARILAELNKRLDQGDAGLLGLNPAHDCHVHGDLHFENIRINPAEADLGTYWLIDPKEFQRGDYVYDVAKLLTSLTGHAHADIGENEKDNPRLKWTTTEAGRIHFNCILTPRQVKGWQQALEAVEGLATAVANRLEPGSSDAPDADAANRMRQRLLLALARHYFSSVRYFLTREAQWLLFARGAQFLALFQRALAGESETSWDAFKVCAGDSWLESN